jgi:hypothetical protein
MKAGTADVEVPESSPVAPLILRCGFGVWIGEARLGTARRTGDVLDAQDVSAAVRVWEARERGEPVGTLLAEEVDADPEYRDWIEEVLVPASAALTATLATAPAVPMRRRPVYFGNPFAVAASVLLMVSLGWAGGLLWQDQRLEDLASEKARAQEELRLEREKHNGELHWKEEAHRRVLAETERRAEQARQRDRERITELERRLEDLRRPEALLNVPFVGLSPRDPVRGEEIEEVTFPAKTGLFFLLLSVTNRRPFPSYRLEVVSKTTGRVVWKGEGLKPRDHDVTLALQREVLSPDDYQLSLYGLKNGKVEPVGDYEFRVVHP